MMTKAEGLRGEQDDITNDVSRLLEERGTCKARKACGARETRGRMGRIRHMGAWARGHMWHVDEEVESSCNTCKHMWHVSLMKFT